MGGTSQARVEANRRNAQRSTGPKTAEGKARSRGNAVKHGLRGDGIALLDEDAAAVELRFATLQAEERPADLMGHLLLHQVALASVRVERAAKLEAATLEPLIRHASADFERDRLAEVDRLFATNETCPGDHRRRLMAQPEGVDKLVAALQSARDQLRGGQVYKHWTAADQKKFEALFGGTGGQFPATRTDALLIALHGDASYFPAEATAHLTTKEGRGAWAAAELIAEVDAELARLADARAAIDHDALGRDRQTAPARAGISPDPGLALARKYVTGASRDFARAYRDHRRHQAEHPADADELAESPAADEPNASPAANAPAVPAADEPNASPVDPPIPAPADAPDDVIVADSRERDDSPASPPPPGADEPKASPPGREVRPATAPPPPVWVHPLLLM